MSRRVHHPARRHVRNGKPGDARPAEVRPPEARTAETRVPKPGQIEPPAEAPRQPGPRPASNAHAPERDLAETRQSDPHLSETRPPEAGARPSAATAPPVADRPSRPLTPANGAAPAAPPLNGGEAPRTFDAGADLGDRAGCTAPQLRRFIKSRAYVPMHELRRRFAIEGTDDDVTQVDLEAGSRVYVGLPQREGLLLGELLRAGDVGYELSLDPISPIVVGVFPMRPVPRV